MPSGSYKVVYCHANHLTREGHRCCIVYTAASSDQNPRQVVGRIAHRLLWTSGLRRWFPLLRAVRERYSAQVNPETFAEFDVVIAGCWRTGEVLRSMGQCGVLRALLVHHYEAEVRPDLASAVLPTLWDPTILKLCVSSGTKSRVEQLGASFTVLALNGIEHQMYRRSVGGSRLPRSLSFNFVDRPIKNPDLLQATIWEIFRRRPDSRMRGFGVIKPRRNFPPSVEFFRGLSDSRIVTEVYQRTEVFLATSTLEGFGFTIAEAMSCGCVPVTTDSKGISDFLFEGATGRVIARPDPHELADAVIQLWDDHELRAKFQEGARQQLAAFRWQDRSSELAEACRIAIGHQGKVV